MFRRIFFAQDFSVCLRCQYRLSLRPETRSGRRYSTGYPKQLRRFTSGPSPRQEQSYSHDAITDNGNAERAPIRYCTEELPPNQKYRHGNEPSTKGRLGLNVLGEPAEVLILRDRNIQLQLDEAIPRVRASGSDENPAQETISSSEMLEKMDAEREITDIDEVCKNIENVGSSWAAKKKDRITGVAYNDLVSRLQMGFTRQQLGVYLDRAGKDPAADVFDLKVEISNSLYARSSWQIVGNTPPQKSKAPRIADSTPMEVSKEEFLGKERGQGLSKEALVKRILRQCWKITPEFQESSLGELDIRLKQLHLDLILNHKRDILKLLSRSYDSKVEAWPQDCIIRITSDYDNCTDIFKLLLHTLENIQDSTIGRLDVDSMPQKGSKAFPRKLTQTTLRQVEKYTNTIIRLDSVSRKTLRVFYLGPDNADLLETQRLIHQILRPASVQKIGLVCSKGRTLFSATPAPVEVGSRLSMLNRNQQWSRWCSPQTNSHTQKQEEKNGSPPSSKPAGLTTQAIHGKKAFSRVKSFFGAPDDTSYKLCNNLTPYWEPEIEYHDSVKFGQVLFPTNTARSIAETLKGKRIRRNKTLNVKVPFDVKLSEVRPIDFQQIGSKSWGVPREFVPLVPGLVRSLESLGSLKKSEEFWYIRLSPSFKNLSLPVPTEALPDLEIRISLDHDYKTTSVKDVRLLIRKEKDFLQPRNVVDLCFVRKECVYAKHDNLDPRIASFVQDSNLDPWGTERIKTPLGLSLSIPALAIQSHKGFDPKSYETLLVDYTSCGIEHRSSLTMPYGGSDSWPTLAYTNIEAGPIGGSRDEICLQNLRITSKQLLPTGLASSAVSIDEDSLSDDDHTSILFQKTASFIESIEQAGKGGGTDDLAVLELSRITRRRGPGAIVRKVDPGKSIRKNMPGYVPPVNDTVRRVVVAQAARPAWLRKVQ